MENSGGWLWIVAVVLVLVLGAAIRYGYSQWRHRRTDPGTKAAENSAVKELYRQDTK